MGMSLDMKCRNTEMNEAVHMKGAFHCPSAGTNSQSKLRANQKLPYGCRYFVVPSTDYDRSRVYL